MPVSAEAAIERLLPQTLEDPELVPKLDEHRLSEDEVREALTEHADELAAATSKAQQDWADATDAVKQAVTRLTEYEAQSALRRARLALWRRLLRPWPFRSQDVSPDPDELAELISEAEKQEDESQTAWWVSAYTNWARPQVNALINDYEDPSYHSKLPAIPGSGLAEVFHPEYEVPTAVGDKLSGLFTHMPGGSIGLCGFRGSGKTTLIRSLCQTRGGSAEGGPSLGFVVSAPVRYEPRDFVLYLFARLCQEILGIRPGREPRHLDAGSAPARMQLSTPALLAPGPIALLAAGLIVIAAGAVELASALSHRSFGQELKTITGTSWVHLAAGIVLLYVGAGLISLYAFGYLRRRRLRAADARPAAWATDSLVESAREWLAEIRYELTYTSGWSGSLNVSVAQASANRSTEAEERERTLPNVIAGYRELAEAVSQEGVRLFIGIDELDKISSDEDAERFLNEIKAIFGIEGCFYLVSVSENAMSSFERRGLPFRDVFDSTFDEIVRIERFSYAQSRLLIKRRTIMPEPFIALCHCVSGGLPRDLIRTARTLYRLNAKLKLGGSLENITRALITEDLSAKAAASWVELARLTAEPEATLFKSWFMRVTASSADGDGQGRQPPNSWLVNGNALYQTSGDFWTEAGKWPNASSASGPDGDGPPAGTKSGQHALISSLGLEINAYRYLAASIVQFFGSQPSDSDLRTASDPTAGKASFEMLAEARLLFVNSPLLAWGLISDFRDAHKMQFLKQPDPCWFGAAGQHGTDGAAGRDSAEPGRTDGTPVASKADDLPEHPAAAGHPPHQPQPVASPGHAPPAGNGARQERTTTRPTTAESNTPTSPAPPSRPRLRLQPDLSARTLIDGGWWPRSADPAAELPGLILAIEKRHGPITRIMLGRADWDASRPRWLRVDGPAGSRIVRLGWFETMPAGLLIAIARAGRTDLLTVPPHTNKPAAWAAIEQAAKADNRTHTPALLAMAAAAARPTHRTASS